MKKYYVNDVEVDEDEFEQRLYQAVEDETSEDEFDDELDATIDPMTIGYIEFYPSQVLYNCDLVAYNIGYREYLDNKVESYADQLQALGYVEVGEDCFEVVEDED